MCAVVDVLNYRGYFSLRKSNGYRFVVMLLSKVNNKKFKPTHGEPSGERDTLHRWRSHGV